MLRRERNRRGSLLLEFALTLPFIILTMIAVVDLGRIALAYTALQDSTAASARAVARTGVVGTVGGGACTDGAKAVPGNVAMYAFCNAVDTVPFINEAQIVTVTPSTYCSRNNLYVRVSAEARPSLILVDYLPEGWKVQATAVARCEVGRG